MDRWTPREICRYFLILLILSMSFLNRKTKHGTFIWGWWGRVAAIHPFDQTGCQHYKSLHTTLHYTCAHKHAVIYACVHGCLRGRCMPTRSHVRRQAARDGGGVLIAICGRAKCTTGTVWMWTEGVHVCWAVCSFTAMSCLTFRFTSPLI